MTTETSSSSPCRETPPLSGCRTSGRRRRRKRRSRSPGFRKERRRQSRAFWPLYRDYRAELSAQGDRLVALIENYAKNYDTLSDTQARAMVDDFLAIQKEENRIKTSWVPKLGKVLPPKSLARFFQIENKMDAIIRFEVAAEVPLVEHGPQGK